MLFREMLFTKLLSISKVLKFNRPTTFLLTKTKLQNLKISNFKRKEFLQKFLLNSLFLLILLYIFNLMNIKWWIKIFIGFAITFVMTIKKNNEMEFNSYIFNFIKYFIWRTIIFASLGISLNLYFDLNIIYCDDESDTSNNNNNSKNEKSYNYSGNIDKGIIKEVVQGVVEGVGNIVPVVAGSIAGVGLGSAIIKSSSGLPPLQKAALGVATAVTGSLGVTVTSGVGKEITKNILKKNENLKSKDSSDDDIISSILEFGDDMSPLQALLNYEIIICLLILFHIVILILILFNKLYVSGSINLISKLINKNILVKYEKYKIMVEKLGNRFLILLFIINVIFLIGYILLLIYINFELSSNLDDYINVHNNMKNNISLLLLSYKFNKKKSKKNIKI